MQNITTYVKFASSEIWEHHKNVKSSQLHPCTCDLQRRLEDLQEIRWPYTASTGHIILKVLGSLYRNSIIVITSALFYLIMNSFVCIGSITDLQLFIKNANFRTLRRTFLAYTFNWISTVSLSIINIKYYLLHETTFI